MADSPTSSILSDPPSAVESDAEDNISVNIPSSRPSIDISHADIDHLAPPSKKRKTGPTGLSSFERALSSQPADEDDNISLSSDGWSSGPGEKDDDEHSLREQAQMQCMWKECDFGIALNNDDLLRHVQNIHCSTVGPKKSKYVCEWGECQRKTSNHPSGYALKAHMRSHTKEKPYYCALPECDKAFTRSDALAKHMRTVHEPEPLKAVVHESTPPTKKGFKIKLSNGNGHSKSTGGDTSEHDDDTTDIGHGPGNIDINYIPAHHPVTGQPGFMIHYPPDILFTGWESSISADQLMRMLRRQLHWAEQEGEEIRKEIEELERQRRKEWTMKEILLEGVLEHELAAADFEGLLRDMDPTVLRKMVRDIEPAKSLSWTNYTEQPKWRRSRKHHTLSRIRELVDAAAVTTPSRADSQDTPSPPPTGQSGGFDGEDDPYDNWLKVRMAQYEAQQSERSREKDEEDDIVIEDAPSNSAEADAVGALLGLSHNKA